MPDLAQSTDILSGQLAEVDRQRLRRENQRLRRRIDDLTEELARARQMQRLESQLLQREQSLRRDMIRELRQLLSQTVKVRRRPPAAVPPSEEIPSFLRRSAATAEDSDAQPLRAWFERRARRLYSA